MKIKSLISRFLLPRSFITLYYYSKFGCIISPRAEVELSSNLIIGEASQISSFVKIKASNGPLTIGKKVDIASGCFLSSGSNGVQIGDDCLIGPNCTIVSGNYGSNRLDLTFREQGHRSKGTKIGNNVLIGAGTVINDGSNIGDGTIVSTNSVISREIPPNSVVQGNPAKVIFTRR